LSSNIYKNDNEAIAFKDMHLNNQEFRKQLQYKYQDIHIYKKVIKQIKKRPEIAPFYLLNKVDFIKNKEIIQKNAKRSSSADL